MKVTVSVDRAKRGRYRAVCLGLPGCHAYGHSRAEAVANVDPVIRGYLASLNRATPRNLKLVISPPDPVAQQSSAKCVAGRAAWASR